MRILIIFLFFFTIVFAQLDEQAARKVIQSLTNSRFSGRGYVNQGSNKTADFISDFFKEHQLSSFMPKTYFQNFSISVNTFPKKMNVVVNDKLLSLIHI